MGNPSCCMLGFTQFCAEDSKTGIGYILQHKRAPRFLVEMLVSENIGSPNI